MLLLGSMRAEERLLLPAQSIAAFCGARLFAHIIPIAHDASRNRQLSRIKLETVSRALSQLQESKLINVRNRSLEILCLPGLQACMGKRAR